MKSAAAVVSALVLLVTALAIADKAKPDAKPSARAACPACREKNPPIDPAKLSDDDAAARPAYAAAAKYPETIDKIHCYCGCEESPSLNHASLLTCFTSLHATGCEICRGEAELAGKMKSEGSGDDEIKKVVESFYQKD
jgi:hypothetical protein